MFARPLFDLAESSGLTRLKSGFQSFKNTRENFDTFGNFAGTLQKQTTCTPEDNANGNGNQTSGLSDEPSGNSNSDLNVDDEESIDNVLRYVDCNTVGYRNQIPGVNSYWLYFQWRWLHMKKDKKYCYAKKYYVPKPVSTYNDENPSMQIISKVSKDRLKFRESNQHVFDNNSEKITSNKLISSTEKFYNYYKVLKFILLFICILLFLFFMFLITRSH
jgi:hypothetical protein